jgi:hypothetical protein
MFDVHDDPRFVRWKNCAKMLQYQSVAELLFFQGTALFNRSLEDSAQGQFEQVSFARKDMAL